MIPLNSCNAGGLEFFREQADWIRKSIQAVSGRVQVPADGSEEAAAVARAKDRISKEKELDITAAEALERGLKVLCDEYAREEKSAQKALDDHARGQAVRVLLDMAGGSKLVGIISHVTELRQEIDEQLSVTKDEFGSHAAWV